jgi:hypothetical protein
LARLSVDDKSGLGILLRKSALPTISYWIDSHERLRRKRLKHPEVFILPHTWPAPSDIGKEYFEDPCVTFTMLEGRGVESTSLWRITSLEENEKDGRLVSVLNAMGLRFRMEVVAQVAAGKPLSRAIANIADRFKLAMPYELFGELHHEIMAESVEHLQTIFGGLD